MSSTRRLSILVDALASGRGLGKFEVDAEDVDVVRTAIALRAARPGDAYLDTEFVSGLYENLNDQMQSSVVPIARPPRGRRAALAAVVAGLVLVGGSAAATDVLLSQGGAIPAATPVPRGTAVRTGTFESAEGRVMGQIVVYGGNPSWLVMNVDGSSYSGVVSCTLQVEDGSTVSTGAFTLHAGKGEWSKPIYIDTRRLRGANLVARSGAIVASATLA